MRAFVTRENDGHENGGPFCRAWICGTWKCRTWQELIVFFSILVFSRIVMLTLQQWNCVLW